jgi:hypothetical protein
MNTEVKEQFETLKKQLKEKDLEITMAKKKLGENRNLTNNYIEEEARLSRELSECKSELTQTQVKNKLDI